MGIGGITLSTSLVTLFNACVLGILITKKLKMDYKSLFTNLLKMSIAGVISLGICYVSAICFDKFVVMPKTLFELVKISVIAIICVVTYTSLNLIFKMEYAQELKNRIVR
jgi:peptidoglycan biosynthesis protein MviN/MurJ (putative lipid II flippase)